MDSSLFEIERIIKKKTSRGQKYYLVRWSGYDEEEDEWKSYKELKECNCLELIDAFEEEQKAKIPPKLKRTTRRSMAPVPEPTPVRRSSRLAESVNRPVKTVSKQNKLVANGTMKVSKLSSAEKNSTVLPKVLLASVFVVVIGALTIFGPTILQLCRSRM